MKVIYSRVRFLARERKGEDVIFSSSCIRAFRNVLKSMVYMSGTNAKRYSTHRKLRIVLGTVAVVCLIWAFASIPYDLLREERARLYGEEATTGVVLSVRSDVSPDYPDAGLVVDFKYVDPDGFARTASARMPDSEWMKYRSGMTIKVVFVRNRPDIVRLPGEVEPAFQLWLRDLMN